MVIAARADDVVGGTPGESACDRDAALVARVSKGDERAFVELYERHRKRLHRLAYGVLLDADEAREAVQEAFLRLHLAAATWAPRARVETWLYRVVLNHCLGLRRRLWRLARRSVERVSPDPSPEAQAALGEAVWVVLRSLGRLPLQSRAIACLFLEAELAPAEIAEIVKLTPNATRVALHRALTRLREDLRAAGIDAMPARDEAPIYAEDSSHVDAP
jgi:RNA polymerase sigma-70 factor (ECF subfamily)